MYKVITTTRIVAANHLGYRIINADDFNASDHVLWSDAAEQSPNADIETPKAKRKTRAGA